mgnify:CR=1 FL=1
MSEYINYNGSKIKNLTGRIFGDYKAIKPVDIKNKSAQWECECTKCGDKCIIGTHDISSGKFCPKYKSKENREKWNNREKKGNKLILKAGNKYDRWIVRKPIEGKTGNYYECICEECGTVREIPAKILKRGTKAYSCKCSKTETGIDPKNDLDMANPDTFSHKNIKVLYKVNGNGVHSAWKCKCLLCGNEWDIVQSSLFDKNLKSCGCYKRNLSSKNVGGYVNRIYGTNVSRIRSNKINKNNTSGVTGVYYNKNMQKWSARIVFKRKTYFLGNYKDKQDAIFARKNAEKELYGNFLEWYAKEYPERWERLNKSKKKDGG